MRRITPLGALVRGLAAGTAGASVMTVFFRLTSGYAPAAPRFATPDQKQAKEDPTATVARRVVDGLMKRGPLPAMWKERASTGVHLAFGAGWSALYGLARETFPSLRHPAAGAAFGTAVWAASDDVILPVFRLGPWPARVPLKNHAYFLAAHLVYGFATWAAYESSRPKSIARVAAGLWGWRLARRFPTVLRPLVRRSARAATHTWASATIH